jgi:hypothetical protein
MVVPNEILEETSTNWELFFDERRVLSSDDKSITYAFDSYGNYVLRVVVEYE